MILKMLEYMDEEELRDLLNGMGHAITGEAARQNVERPLFVLVLFNDPKVGQYVSNVCREDAIKALRECADRLERREDVTR